MPEAQITSSDAHQYRQGFGTCTVSHIACRLAQSPRGPWLVPATESWLLPPRRSIAKLGSAKELRLDTENAQLRQLLLQAGIDAAEQKVMDGLHRLLLEELHHRIKN